MKTINQSATGSFAGPATKIWRDPSKTTIEYQNPWFRVLKQDKYHFVDEPKSETGAAVLLESNEGIVLVEQFRFAIDRRVIEIPRGYANQGESSVDCAIREVFEETGFNLRKEDLKLLGYMNPNSGILTSTIPLYYGRTEAAQDPNWESDEIDKRVFLSRAELRSRIARSDITDSFTLSAFLLFINSPETSLTPTR